MPKLKLLSPDTQNLLKSGYNVPTYSQIVTELVENSIDAGATTINIELQLPPISSSTPNICYEAPKIKVQDNGHGISAEDLKLLGHQYMTSKINSLDHQLNDGPPQQITLGFRGQAISSISTVSKVTVISRSDELAEGHCYQAQIKNPQQQQQQQQSQTNTTRNNNNNREDGGGNVVVSYPKCPFNKTGTIFLVDNIYSKFPVRLQELKTRKGIYKQIEQIKHHAIEKLAMVYPQVTFILTSRAGGATIKRLMVLNKAPSVYQRFQQIYGNVIGKGLDYLGLEWNQMELEGCITRYPIISKKCQKIYFGKRLLDMPEIYNLVNEIFKASKYFFSPSQPQPQDYSSIQLKQKCSNSSSNSSKKPTRSKMKYYPAYLLIITKTPTHQPMDIIAGNPNKEIIISSHRIEIAKLIGYALIKFLKKYHLIEDQQITDIVNKIGDPMYNPLNPFHSRMVQTNNPRVSTKPNPKGYGDVGLKNLPPLTLPTAKKEGLGDDDSSSRLMNCKTSEPFYYKTMVENSRSLFPGIQTQTTAQSSLDVDDQTQHHHPTTSQDNTGSTNTSSLYDMWKNWKNPVIPRYSTAIADQAIYHNDPLLHRRKRKQKPWLYYPIINVRNTINTINAHNVTSAAAGGGNSNKKSMMQPDNNKRSRELIVDRDLAVIGQVGKQIIVCKSIATRKDILDCEPQSDAEEEGGGGEIMAIDQHAADERIRVERLYGELWRLKQKIMVEYTKDRDQHRQQLSKENSSGGGGGSSSSSNTEYCGRELGVAVVARLMRKVLARLENANNNNCEGGGVTILRPPIRVGLSRSDTKALEKYYLPFFYQWGIGLAITATGQNNSSANGNSGGGGADKNSRYGEQGWVEITHLPTIVASRFTANNINNSTNTNNNKRDIMTAGENELAKQLVATYFEWLETHVGKESAIAKQEKMVVYSNTNNAGDNENSQIAWSSSQPWPNMLPECPKVLIGIIQSLACRGAIKFGDVLDRQQCSKLVDDLKKCLYPQYCAHGRTSVASLFQMSIMPDSSEDAGTDPAVVGSELSIVDSTDSQNKNNQDAFRRKYKRFRKRHCDYHHHLHN